MSDAGGAFIVTSEERARDLATSPVAFLGAGHAFTHRSIAQREDITSTGAVESARRAYEVSGVGLGEIDVFEICDAFSTQLLVMLEDVGLCAKGEGGPFVDQTDFGPGGQLPLNTSGGGLSYLHPGMFGMFLVIEAVRQLRGECEEHQVPGGMISNLRSQIRDMNMEDCLEAVLEEAGQVREDLGYPILVSPFAQFVITQAVINVVQKERYATIPDEVARYVFGYYGTPPGPISQRVLDRAAATGKVHEPMTDRPGALVPPRIERLKKERGPFESDDDLLLHAFYQPSQLEPLFRERELPERTGAVPRPADISVKALLEEVRRLPRHGSVSIRQSGLAVDGSR